MDVLAKVGGFEIAGMVGAFLGGMKYGIPVIIDGVISAVVALAAARICPKAVECMLPSHMLDLCFSLRWRLVRDWRLAGDGLSGGGCALRAVL